MVLLDCPATTTCTNQPVPTLAGSEHAMDPSVYSDTCVTEQASPPTVTEPTS